MRANFENTGARYGKVFFLIAVLVTVFSEVSAAQRKIDCRKFVFAPPCRGIAAKRDTSSHTDYRYTVPAEYGDYSLENQKIPSSASENSANMNGLLGLLKRAISNNIDSDTGTNYMA